HGRAPAGTLADYTAERPPPPFALDPLAQPGHCPVVPRSIGVAASLVRIAARDGVWLDGVVAEPRGHRGTAVLCVHGLGSVFSSGQPLTRELSTRLNSAGVAFFKLNNRGHDVVAGRGRQLAGAAFERFGQSVLDIRAMVAFARRCGYRRVVLAGHSTGANKVLYYADARWPAFRSVRLPIAAILGSRDEFLDRPAREVIEAFRRNAVRARSFTGAVVPRARHGFQGHERELADLVVSWIGRVRTA